MDGVANKLTDFMENIIEIKDEGLLYIRILKATEYHKLGEILDVEPRFGEALIEEGIAEKVPFETYKEDQKKKFKKMILKALKKNDKEEKKVSAIGLKIDNFLINAREFYKVQPYIYDKTNIWWLWKGHKWEITDDIDLMRDLDNQLGFLGQTVSSSIRNNHLQAMMWVGREHSPKESPVKWIQFNEHAFSLNSKNIYGVTPDYFFTNPIPWELGENEETPTLDKLFTEWVGKDYVQSLYEIIAYCCYRDYPIQTLICLFGSGRNGKTCFIRLLCKFLGKENTCSTELDSLLDSRFESFKLYRKLACFMGETNFGVLDKSSMLKKLTGSDMIGFEKKGKDPFNDYSYSKLIIASNSLPTATDTSDGFYRRWFIIDFPNEFSEGKDVLQDIPEIEYNNLARKVMSILPDLLKRGSFCNQGSIENRKDKYIMASNPLSIFIKKFYEKDAFGFISYAELYTHYVQFLRQHKKRRVRSKEFKAALEEEGLWVEKTSKKIMKKTGFEEFTSGYWVEGIKKIDNCDNYTQNHIPPYREMNGMENRTELSQFDEKQTFESCLAEKEFVHCQIKDCPQTPCKRDDYGEPFCFTHFEDHARFKGEEE